MHHSIRSSLLLPSLLLTLSSKVLYQTEAFSQIPIQACQNKDCIKKFQSSTTNSDGGIIQMITDLIPPKHENDFIIESSGCLAQCGLGPNICIKNNNMNGGEGRIFHDVKDVQTAAAILEVGGGIDCPIELMVAVDMMSQASQSRYKL